MIGALMPEGFVAEPIKWGKLAWEKKMKARGFTEEEFTRAYEGVRLKDFLFLGGQLSKGFDFEIPAFVVNFTRNYFSVGLTTSPSATGKFVGIVMHDRAAKNVGGGKFKPFRGRLCQCGFWWFKIYLYLYFDGDGLRNE